MAKAVQTKPDRRSLISKALFKCMSDKGYANTSLKDVAGEASMSPSHLGYYFDNKAAILEYFASATCRQTIEGFPSLQIGTSRNLITDLTNFCLGPGQMSIGLLGAIQEITGLAAHDKALFKIKSQHSNRWHEYLEQFFLKIKCRKGLSAKTAAWQLHATIIGLNTNLIFDKGLSRKQAYDLLNAQIHFLSAMSMK